MNRAMGAVTAAALLLAAGCTSHHAATDIPTGYRVPPPSPSPTPATVRVGQPFDYQQTYSDGSAPNQWSITVTSLQCGLSRLKNGADNPAYNSGKWSYPHVPPQTIDALAPAGKTFCRLDAKLTNTGTEPADRTDTFGDIETSAGTFAATPEEDMYVVRNLLAQEHSSDGPYNPGDVALAVKVWTVPAGATPVAAAYPDHPLPGVATYRITAH